MRHDDRALVAAVLLALSAWSWLTPWPWWHDALVLAGLLVVAYYVGSPEP